MAERKRQLCIEFINREHRMLSVSATPEAGEQLKRIKGISYCVDSFHDGRYTVFISGLYDFLEVVAEIDALEQPIP